MTMDAQASTLQPDGAQQRPWHHMTAPQAIEELATRGEGGLTTEQARERLEHFGPNALREAPTASFWELLWSQFTSFLVLILIAASILSLVLGDIVEAIAVMAIVLLNAIIGVIQESRAEGALRALRKLAAPRADVLRDGEPTSVPAEQLVPGDVVLLQTGNRVPADIRLIETYNLRVDEASLTGESQPVTSAPRA